MNSFYFNLQIINTKFLRKIKAFNTVPRTHFKIILRFKITQNKLKGIQREEQTIFNSLNQILLKL